MSNIPYWTPHDHVPIEGKTNCDICGECLPTLVSELRKAAVALAHQCYQAITTSDVRNAYGTFIAVLATCDARTLSRDWDHELNYAANHAAAAIALATSLSWTISGMGSTSTVGSFTFTTK